MQGSDIGRYLRRALAILVGVLIVAFAIVNRHQVTVNFWPLPIITTMPLYLVIIGVLVIGVIIGGVATWFAAHRRRSAARRDRRRIETLEQEVQVLRSRSGGTGLAGDPDRR